MSLAPHSRIYIYAHKCYTRILFARFLPPCALASLRALRALLPLSLSVCLLRVILFLSGPHDGGLLSLRTWSAPPQARVHDTSALHNTRQTLELHQPEGREKKKRRKERNALPREIDGNGWLMLIRFSRKKMLHSPFFTLLSYSVYLLSKENWPGTFCRDARYR